MKAYPFLCLTLIAFVLRILMIFLLASLLCRLRHASAKNDWKAILIPAGSPSKKIVHTQLDGIQNWITNSNGTFRLIQPPLARKTDWKLGIHVMWIEREKGNERGLTNDCVYIDWNLFPQASIHRSSHVSRSKKGWKKGFDFINTLQLWVRSSERHESV